MKVASISGPRQGGSVEKADPLPREDIVVVKVHVAPLCTEYYSYKNGDVGDNLGHEAVGEVSAVDKTTRVRVGDRVVVQPMPACGKCYLCRTGNFIHCQQLRDMLAETGSAAGLATQAQYTLKAESLLTPIPDDMSYEHAAMACCGLGPTFGAMQLTSVDAFDTVLITGLGPVGLGGVINACFRGARVIGVESHPYRVALAKELGADAVINPADPDAVAQILALTGGVGVDKAVETSGVAEAKTTALEALRRKGQFAMVGWSGQLDASTIIAKGLSIYGAWHYNLNDAGRLLQMIERVPTQIDALITHKFALADVQQAWEVQCSGACGKVILYPWG